MTAGAYASSLPTFAMGGSSMSGMKKIARNRASPNFNPDVDMELTCQPGEAPILEGRATGAVALRREFCERPPRLR